MRIIFSRKGFDSAAGGFPSMIFPDGTLFSIPIPNPEDSLSYSDLPGEYEGEPIWKILSDLTNNKIHKRLKCHYDPMPFRKSPVFDGLTLGQVSTSEAHLRNQGVSEDDIFLFYGWFKSIRKIDGKWRYSDKDIHLIWSYMTVGDSVCLDTDEQQKKALKKYPFLKEHPHIGKQGNIKNRIYLSKNSAAFSFDPKRCLTNLKDGEYEGRSTWRLPSCFTQPQAFSYLKNFDKPIHDEVIVRFRGYGQEFVLNLDKVDTDDNRKRIVSHVKHLITP